jgi:hypothetical protein
VWLLVESVSRARFTTKKKGTPMRTLLFPICILGISSVSLAQGKPATWENLNKLHQGDKIQVLEMNKTKVTGAFSSVSDAAISLQGNGSPQTIQRQEVLSVKLMRNKHRLRNTLIVAGAGAGVGAGIGAATFHPCPSTQTFCFQIGGRSLPAGIGAVAGFLGGAVVGALLPEHETVYRMNSQ